MTQAAIVVVTGPPGTGKTALASRLRERHGWTVLAKDTIKEALFDALGAGDRAWSGRLSDASYELIFRLARHAVGHERVLVLEGNFRPGHWSRIAELVASRDAALLVVELHADREVLRRRLGARTADPRRHPGHLDRELIAEVGPADTRPDDDAAIAAALRGMGVRRLQFETRDLDDETLDRIAADVSRSVVIISRPPSPCESQ